MVDLTHLQQVARVVKDENGNEMVQIPRELWEEAVGHIEPQPSQIEQIMEVLREFENEPDDKSDEWWDEFNEFLKANRLNFEERDLGFDDE
jgi:hypothetical protein